MRVAPVVDLSPQQREALEQRSRARSLPARVVERARIVLLAAEGKQHKQIAELLGIGMQKAARWRARFLELGVAGLEKVAPRPGRTPSIAATTVTRVVRMTTQDKPSNATHWSTRTMAAAAGISETSVRRIWRKHGLKPHLVKTFKLSRDPRFSEKLEVIVGLYLNPPEHALVLCCDEKSQIQALDRTQPGLPLKRGRAGTMTHDYKRNGTATLFAALNTVDGKVTGMCLPRHRHQEWLWFLKHLDAVMPAEKQLHLIVDNYATHKHAKVQRWLKRHPRFHFHFTPTGSSWLNMVERFFRDLTANRLRRGVFRDVPELVEAIETYVERHNENPKPFIWTAQASDILAKVKRARKSLVKVQSV
ncbi:MAG TPA: IS630 family transposase [Candidatus Limnocylindria bacterium]|nr:IS630 family transposase [Candidatus Limnocylindria bacterium]